MVNLAHIASSVTPIFARILVSICRFPRSSHRLVVKSSVLQPYPSIPERDFVPERTGILSPCRPSRNARVVLGTTATATSRSQLNKYEQRNTHTFHALAQSSGVQRGMLGTLLLSYFPNTRGHSLCSVTHAPPCPASIMPHPFQRSSQSGDLAAQVGSRMLFGPLLQG